MIHVLIFLPALAGLIGLVLPRWARGLGLLATLISAGLGLFYLLGGPGMRALVEVPLLKEAGVYYAVGVDGVGAAFAFLVPLVVFLALVALPEAPGRMLALGLLMTSGLLGIFLSLDLVLFYLFYEATLIPSLLLLGVYGGENRVKALIKFALFTLLGSLLMLAGILAARYLGGAETFLLRDLLAHRVGGAAATWAFLAFALAFWVKTPLFPLHVWLPDFHAGNHPSGFADVLGTLYKVGAFGFFRWAIPLFPEAFLALKPYLLFFAAFTALWGAWIAYAQTDWKRLIAYGALAHMGIAALGVFSGTTQGATGALFLLSAGALYTGGLFLLAGWLYRRFGTLAVAPTHGLAKHAPALAAVFLFMVLAMIGLPGLAGFPGEFMSLLGAWAASPGWTLLGFLSVIAAAAWGLTAYQRLFHGPPGQRVADLRGEEWVYAVLAAALIAFLGLYPRLVAGPLAEGARALAALFGGGQ